MDLFAIRQNVVNQCGDTYLAMFFCSTSIPDEDPFVARKYVTILDEGDLPGFWGIILVIPFAIPHMEQKKSKKTLGIVVAPLMIQFFIFLVNILKISHEVATKALPLTVTINQHQKIFQCQERLKMLRTCFQDIHWGAMGLIIMKYLQSNTSILSSEVAPPPMVRVGFLFFSNSFQSPGYEVCKTKISNAIVKSGGSALRSNFQLHQVVALDGNMHGMKLQ